MKLTGWYHKYQKPFRKGIYEREMEDGTLVFSYWDGRHWYLGAFSDEKKSITISRAFRYFKQGAFSARQFLSWRGIAK